MTYDTIAPLGLFYRPATASRVHRAALEYGSTELRKALQAIRWSGAQRSAKEECRSRRSFPTSAITTSMQGQDQRHQNGPAKPPRQLWRSPRHSRIAALGILISLVLNATIGAAEMVPESPIRVVVTEHQDLKCISNEVWSDIVVAGAEAAFIRSKLNVKVMVAPYRTRPSGADYIVGVLFLSGYREVQGTETKSLAVALAHDDFSVIEKGGIRFYMGKWLNRRSPVPCSSEWLTAMSAVLAHEIVHIIAPGCNHDSDSSTIFGAPIDLDRMTATATFSNNVRDECFSVS